MFSLNLLFLLLQFFHGHDTPIVYPVKETAADNDTNDTPSDVTNSLETQSEPIFPSESPFNNVVESLINTEISRSDPCVAGNVLENLMASEIDDPNVSDGSNKAIEVKNSNVAHEIHSPNTAHGSSAFTKVAPSKQPWTTREVGEIPKVEDIPLFMPAPEGAVGYTADIPELIYRDEKTSEMLNALEDNTESFEIQSEILNNTDTINIPQQNHTHGSTSPVSGNIPPHNTPVIGSNKGEINLQDVRLALTAFNDEFADDHMDNGHDFRRSFSADAYHEDREHGMRLRHHSGI